MSFFALAALLTATSVENSLIGQVEALDKWRSELGFLPDQTVNTQAKEGAAEPNEYVLTAVDAQALDEIAKEVDIKRITDVDAVITDPDAISEEDERVVDITANTTATYSVVEETATSEDDQGKETDKAGQPSERASEGNLNGYSPGDPLRAQQWALDQIGIDDGTSRASGRQKIALIDSGVWTDHPDLAGRATQRFYTGAGQVEELTSKQTSCRRGHGTLTAGITSSTAFNGIGGRGIAPNAQLIDINVTNPEDCGKGPTMSATIASINLATELKVDTIVMSYGFRMQNFCALGLQQAIDRARAAGITVVAAAGNQRQHPVYHSPEIPASCNGVISVGATHRGGAVAAYSTQNYWVDVVAPGGKTVGGSSFGSSATHVLTTNWPEARDVPKTQYTGVAGTSFAAPYVAGLVTLIREQRPNATPDEIESIIEHTASRSSPEATTAMGWGEINVPRAIEMAKGNAKVPPRAFEIPFPTRQQAIRQGLGKVQTISRLGKSNGAIQRAIEISQYTFINQGENPLTQRRGQAQWGVLARADVHADALAGASLTLGVAPLLYSTTTLDQATATELTRALKPGSTVYLLGGPKALPPGIENSIKDLGFKPVRLGGTTRIETSIEVAREVRRLVKEEAKVSAAPVSMVTAHDAWADSVGAGYLGAAAGLPVILNPTHELHPKVAQAVRQDDMIYAVGGSARLGEQVVWSLSTSRQPGHVVRLAGPDRVRTMITTTDRLERLRPAKMQSVDVINFDDESAWATALAASVPSAAYAHLPVAVDNNHVEKDALHYVHGMSVPVHVWGPTSVISDSVANQVRWAVSAKNNVNLEDK